MLNRFFTIVVVPEKTTKIRKLVIPYWLVMGGGIALFFSAIFLVIMFFDYWYFINQVGENKTLRTENRRLRQQVQVYKNRMATVEGTMDRIQTFTIRLRKITNLVDKDNLVMMLNQDLPEASRNIVLPAIENGEPGKIVSEKKSDSPLDEELNLLNDSSLLLEQNVQNMYELLADQRSFLLALPTRPPAMGHFSSGFGVRPSPFGVGIKMHEGLDVANEPGTEIHATAYGTVAFAGIKPGYGKTIIIDHGYGLETWYAHARQVLVQAGQKVFRGQRVATMGNTGRSTGSHVHYEVRVHGLPVDPLTYVLE